MIRLEIKGDGLPRFEKMVEELGSKNAHAAYRMGLNKAGAKVFTAVKRTVAKQMGVTQGAAVKHGKFRRIPAQGTQLSTEIRADGGYLLLKDFKARTTKRGVSASPWGKRRVFPYTFVVQKLGGNVFKNTERMSRAGRRNAIEKLWGPAVPRELVRDESRAAFESIGPKVLREETLRQIKRLGKGTIS